MNIQSILGTAQSILEFVLALGVLILLHELGHFVVARLCKVDVEEFGIGFPPRAVTLFERGGTKYSLNWLPFGGFVRLKGEADPTVPGSVMNASPWKRIAITAAGPLMNLITAVILYAVIFQLIGVPVADKVLIRDVSVNSPAEQAGIRPGDLILQVNDVLIDGQQKLSDVIRAHVGEPITVVYEREGQSTTVSLIPRANPPEGEGAMGILMTNPTTPISFFSALPKGLSATVDHCRALLTFVGQAIRGTIPAEQGRLVGFKGMYDMYAQARSEPIAGLPTIINVLGFFTSITVSLGLLNLLPIPALDGGRIMFVLPELVLRKRIPPEYEVWVNAISLGLLILLLLYVNLQDFINPITLP